MDMSWLQKFSGGLDLLPIGIACIGLVLAARMPPARSIEDKLANALALVCYIALPVAQIGWMGSVIRGVPALGSVMDSVWTIYNFASLGALILLQHRRST